VVEIEPYVFRIVADYRVMEPRELLSYDKLLLLLVNQVNHNVLLVNFILFYNMISESLSILFVVRLDGDLRFPFHRGGLLPQQRDTASSLYKRVTSVRVVEFNRDYLFCFCEI